MKGTDTTSNTARVLLLLLTTTTTTTTTITYTVRSVGVDPHGDTLRRGLRPPPCGGREAGQLSGDHPLPAFPPYAVRTPHIHGATDYGDPNSSGGLMMVI